VLALAIQRSLIPPGPGRVEAVRIAEALLALAWIAMLAGCAQSNPKSLPTDIPLDRWHSGVVRDGGKVRYANAGIADAARDAVLLLGCTDKEKSVILVVDPDAELAVEPAALPVTIILDGQTALVQDWKTVPAGYGIDDTEAGFSDLMARLKEARTAEFVLGRPGKTIDRRSFSLNGVAAAIDSVISNCAKKT
jgi:hypothetical protein